nr:4Fe-4S binding protein [Methanohalophilus profundi]
MDRGHAVIDDNKCILCYCCRELCPAEAVKSRKSLVARLLSHS